MVEPVITILGITVAVTVIFAAIGTGIKLIKYSIKAGDKIYQAIRRKADNKFLSYYHTDIKGGVLYDNTWECLTNPSWVDKAKYVMTIDNTEAIACILVLRLSSSRKTKPKKIRLLYYVEGNKIRIITKTSSQMQKIKKIFEKSCINELRFIKTESNIKL